MGVSMVAFLAMVLIPASLYDVRSRRIPNWLSLAGMLLGIALHAAYAGWAGVVESTAGLGLALLLGFFLYAIGWLGAGDAKLLAAIGATVGLSQIFEFLFWILISGGAVAVLMLATHGALLRLLKRYWAILMLSVASRRWCQLPASDVEAVEIPYAIPMALGVLIAVIVGRVWQLAA